jgi:hypothetical protein
MGLIRRPWGQLSVGRRSAPAGPEAIHPPPSTVAIFVAGRRTTGMTK